MLAEHLTEPYKDNFPLESAGVSVPSLALPAGQPHQHRKGVHFSNDEQQIFLLLQIKELINKIIAKNETINLVVVPSNVDIATTEALKMAQEVDPDGERTLGKEWGGE